MNHITEVALLFGLGLLLVMVTFEIGWWMMPIMAFSLIMAVIIHWDKRGQ